MRYLNNHDYNLNNNYTEIEWLRLALREKDSLLEINEKDSLLLTERFALIQLIGDLSTHNRLLSDSLHNYVDSLNTEIVNRNTNIPTQENYEKYERIVNDIYWKTVARGIYEFTNSQTAQLESISGLCPYHGGKAVFYARGLYSLVNDSLTFDDSLLCAQQNVENWRQSNPHSLSQNVEISAVLYPNPASDIITINLSQKPQEATALYIYDIWGRVIYQYTLGEDEKEISISVSNMSSGVYYYSLSQSGKTIFRDKFVVEH